VGTTNSQKKSQNNSEPSERSKPKNMPRSHDNNLDHDHEQEHSFDLVARVREAREVAEREMRKFGKVSEYEVRKVYGQRADLNYDDESVPGLPDSLTHQRDHGGRETQPERDQQSAGKDQPEPDKKQGTLNFENHDTQPRSNEEG